MVDINAGESLSLRIGSIFELFLVSLIGVYLPIILVKLNSTATVKVSTSEEVSVLENSSSSPTKTKNLINSIFFRGLKCFSAGLILAVAFCHLLADSISDLSDDGFLNATNTYPIPLALALFGILLMVCIEELMKLSLKDPSTSFISITNTPRNQILLNPSNGVDDGSKEIVKEGEKGGVGETQVNEGTRGGTEKTVELTYVETHAFASGGLEGCGIHGEESTCCHHEHSLTNLSAGGGGESAVARGDGVGYSRLGAERFSKLVIFEASIALHSVIIGFNLGVLDENSLSTIKALMIALAFHQFFEGFSLGTIISELDLFPLNNFILALIFSMTVSL